MYFDFVCVGDPNNPKDIRAAIADLTSDELGDIMDMADFAIEHGIGNLETFKSLTEKFKTVLKESKEAHHG